MLLPTVSGERAEIDEAVILAAAGRIYERRRKTHGGPKPKTFRCCWCGLACPGRKAAHAHERECPQSMAAKLGI